MNQPIPPSQPFQPPFVPPPAQVKKSPKLLYILLILISLSAASIFAYKYYQLKTQITVVTPSPSLSPSPTLDQEILPELTFEQDVPIDPTADWKIYTNDLFGFSLKYPSPFTITDNLQTSTDPLAWTTKKSLNLVDSVQNYSFSIMINPDGFGPWFPNKLHKLSYSEEKGIYTINTSLNSENLTPDVYSIIGSGDFQVKKVVGFLVFANSSDDVQARTYLDKTFDQILSTFKFIN